MLVSLFRAAKDCLKQVQDRCDRDRSRGTFQEARRRSLKALAFAMLGAVMLSAPAAHAQQSSGYTMNEIVDAGSNFFGTASKGLATGIENIFSSYGQPNGYVLGQEGSGAIIGGLTYGEGTLFTKNAGDHTIYWQGPSFGWDFGASGSKVMILVYNLNTVNDVYRRFAGVAGSAYVVAGLGFNVMGNNDVLIVPIRTGVGARLGVNMGYLKVTPSPTWNPF
ncbi:hypothetical protein GCM10011385_26210 [Nitratireductor aestuarii]|uniref:DUF1134 domain-containing protein n=2 Tax=Nitratireductor aestuarii TaxID=1735103 RepID=A0A916RVD6_9HYPH|nr:hypothetical protein GCM10011385_26210 [Nitratireductor aestuarii]